jgi:hypothetical protein
MRAVVRPISSRPGATTPCGSAGSEGSRRIAAARHASVWWGIPGLLLTLLAAGQIRAESCLASANFAWTAPDQGAWSSCSPDAADDFFANGFTITVAADFEISGSIEADSGGRLVIPAGRTLRALDALRADSGGTIELSGASRYVGRVASVLWSSDAALITVTGTTSGLVEAGDYVHLTDDYGPVGAPLAGPVQTSPGLPAPGATRPAYARGWMFRVLGAAGSWLWISLDDWAGTGSPYVGTRGAGGVGVEVISAEMPGGFNGTVTELVVANADLDVLAAGDLTDQYVEIQAGPCQGKLAKIIGSTDAGGGNDALQIAGPWLAADGSACGTGPAWIDVHYGVRAGDPLAVYRMASVDGGGTGYLEIRAGSIEADRFSLLNLGWLDKYDSNPSLRMHGNIVFRHAEDCSPPLGGWMRRGNIGYFHVPSPESDVGVILGVAHERRGFTWKGCPTFDLSQTVEFDQLFIHDTASSDPLGTGGSHGFINNGAGMRASRLLVVHLSDDGISGYASGFTSDPQPFIIEDARIFGILPDVEKSAECFEPTGDNYLSLGGENEQERVRGKIIASDIMAIGCSREAVNVVAYGASVDRIVASGANYLESTHDMPLFSAAPSVNLTGTPAFKLDEPGYANTVQNALVFIVGRQYAGVPFAVAGRCIGCVVVGSIGRIEGTRLWGITDYVESFIHFTNNLSRILDPVNVAPWRTRSLVIDSSVLLSEYAPRLAGDHFDLDSLQVTDSFIGLSVGAGETLGGVGDVGASVQVAGIAGTSGNPAAGTTLGVSPTATVDDACLETALASDPLAFNGASLGGLITRSSELGPDAQDDALLRTHARSSGGTGACDHAAPESFGLRVANLGRAHADLGDLFLDHWDRYSTDDLVVVPEPAGTLLLIPGAALLALLARSRGRRTNG